MTSIQAAPSATSMSTRGSGRSPRPRPRTGGSRRRLRAPRTPRRGRAPPVRGSGGRRPHARSGRRATRRRGRGCRRDQRPERVAEQLREDVPGVARRGLRLRTRRRARSRGSSPARLAATRPSTPTRTSATPIRRTARRRSPASHTARRAARSVRSGSSHASAFKIGNASCAVSSSSERRISMRPTSSGSSSSTCCADADPVGGLQHDPLEVESHDPAFRRDGLAVALEHLDERPVRLLERGRPQPLETRLLERARDEPVRRLAGSRGRRAREILEVLGELRLDLGVDVDRVEELVDGAGGNRLPDRVVLDELASSCPRRRRCSAPPGRPRPRTC